jgi:hypothetical protein
MTKISFVVALLVVEVVVGVGCSGSPVAPTPTQAVLSPPSSTVPPVSSVVYQRTQFYPGLGPGKNFGVQIDPVSSGTVRVNLESKPDGVMTVTLANLNDHLYTYSSNMETVQVMGGKGSVTIPVTMFTNFIVFTNTESIPVDGAAYVYVMR